MGEVNAMTGLDKADLIAMLTRLNARASAGEIAMYADSFVDYRTAQANIDEHGSVVFHPRTGSPIDNPYLKIRTTAAASMRKVRLETKPLWRSCHEGVVEWNLAGSFDDGGDTIDVEVGADAHGKWWIAVAGDYEGPFDDRSGALERAQAICADPGLTADEEE